MQSINNSNIQLNDEFWMMLNAKYPKAHAVFLNWLEIHKVDVKWESLFNFGKPNYREIRWSMPVIFHNPGLAELPDSMQIGIWIEFVKSKEIDDHLTIDLYNYKQQIEEYAKTLELRLDN